MIGPDAWLNDLIRDGKRIEACGENVRLALTHHSQFRGAFRYNELSGMVDVLGRPWDGAPSSAAFRPLTDVDATHVKNWLERVIGLVRVSQAEVDRQILAIAREHSVHPFREWLLGLKWDGQPRIDGFLVDQLGAADTPAHREVSRCFMISVVARVMRPGVKVDTMPIIEGAQGLLKSSAFKELVGAEHFCDTSVDLGNKDAYLTIHQTVLYEFAELDGFTKADVRKLKAFLSSSVDTFRKPYDKVARAYPRGCVFVGTTNESNYLHDRTGNRRSWVVSVNGPIDLARIRAEREQLWAEAYARFAQGEQWWLAAESARAMEESASERMVEDPWVAALFDFLVDAAKAKAGDALGPYTTEQLFEGALGQFSGAKITQAEATRLGRCMKEIGLERKQVREGSLRVHKYSVGDALLVELRDVAAERQKAQLLEAQRRAEKGPPGESIPATASAAP